MYTMPDSCSSGFFLTNDALWLILFYCEDQYVNDPSTAPPAHILNESVAHHTSRQKWLSHTYQRELLHDISPAPRRHSFTDRS